MEDAERREAHYGQGGLYSRKGTQRLLKRLYQRARSIEIPPDDPGETQGGQRMEEPKVFQGEDLLNHCGPE